MFPYNFECFQPATWNNLDMNALKTDEAYLNVTSNSSLQTTLYSLTSNCENCPFVFVGNIRPGSSEIISVNAAFDTIWRLYSSLVVDEHFKLSSDKRLLICEVSPKQFGEYGVYEIIVTDEDCYISTQKFPVNIYLSLLLIIISFILLWTVGHFLRVECCNLKFMAGQTEENIGRKINSKIKAIDTFRGMCLSLMIIVNSGGGGYWFLSHSPWDGITIADAVFPWFLWIMGVCIALSYKTRTNQNEDKWIAVKDIWRRGVILFGLGLIVNTVGIGPVLLSDLRIMGVLQRFAICYFISASIMTVICFKRYQIKLPSLIEGILILWPQWIIFLALIVVHYLLTFYLPIPGCPTGYIGVGGIQDNGIYTNCTGGTSYYLDKLILGESHLYKGKGLFGPYRISINFDPENILGCLSATFQVFLGIQAGSILIHGHSYKQKFIDCVIWGIIYLILGICTHLTCIPINKNLWSLSFVLVTSGTAFILLAVCYTVIDYRMAWNGAPFIYLGMNSIIVFVGHEICYNLFPWHWRLRTMNTHFILLLENMWVLLVWIALMFWLFKKRFFISI